MKSLKTQKLFQQQPSFYSFGQVIGDDNDYFHQTNQVNKVLQQKNAASRGLAKKETSDATIEAMISGPKNKR